MKKELIPFDVFVEQTGSLAAAARKLDMDYMQVWRWFNKTVKAGRSSRKLAAARGVALP